MIAAALPAVVPRHHTPVHHNPTALRTVFTGATMRATAVHPPAHHPPHTPRMRAIVVWPRHRPYIGWRGDLAPLLPLSSNWWQGQAQDCSEWRHAISNMIFMKMTKLGHSCLFIEEGAARILIDPGIWSEGHTELENLDAILITHKHTDHSDPESLKKILAKNPTIPIYSNDHVHEELAPHGIVVQHFVGGDTMEVKGVRVEGFGQDHAAIYPTYPRTDNTCFLVGDRLYHPGDSLHIPNKPVEILALPIAAPWMHLAEAIDFAKKLKPKKAFAIHDGFFKYVSWLQKHPVNLLMPEGIEWMVLENGKCYEF